jgi:hypothetical protein
MRGLGDVERARQFYQDGEAHFRAGRYIQAANAFVSAHMEEPGHPNPLWSAAHSYERAGRLDSAIAYYDRFARAASGFTGTPRPDHTVAQARAAAERLRQQQAEQSPSGDVIDEIWSWVTGGQEEAPAPGQPSGTTPTSGKGIIGQTVDTVANVFGAGAGKVATDTARQTAALERDLQSGSRAPVVDIPEGGIQLPGWLPYALVATVGLGGVALVAYIMRKRSEEE